MKIRLVKYEKLNFLEALYILQFSPHWYTDSQKDINFNVFSFSGFEKSLWMFSYLLIGQLHQIIMNDFMINFSKFYKMIFQKNGFIKIQKSL